MAWIADGWALPMLALATLIVLAVINLALIMVARREAKAIESSHAPSGEFIEVSGTKLHYRRTGDPSLPAILVLHGAASNLEEPFAALGEALKDRHVIWLDRPGLGWSERANIHWSPTNEAGLIADFLSEIGVASVTLVGHSWGGAIAMRLALDHPDRIDGLVLIAPALGAWIGDAAWFNAASFWPVLGPLITHLVVPLAGKPQLQSGAENAFHPEPVPEAYAERTNLALLLRPSVWRANAMDMRDVNKHLEDQEHRYHEVQTRTVFLAGKSDTVLWSHRHSAVTANRMPNAELRWLAGAGHNLHHHWPDEVVRAIRDVQG